MPGNYGNVMGPPAPRPVTADTLSSSQMRLSGIAGLLPLFVQQTMLASAMQSQIGGAKSETSLDGVVWDEKGMRREGSKGGSKTSGSSGTTTAAPESSRTGENSKLVDTLLSKMFGEDEDPEVKKLRVNLTKQRLRMELKAVQDERRAALRAQRDQDRAYGQAHRERKMKNGPGVPISAEQREYMEKGIRREDEKYEQAKAKGRAAFEGSM